MNNSVKLGNLASWSLVQWFVELIVLCLVFFLHDLALHFINVKFCWWVSVQNRLFLIKVGVIHRVLPKWGLDKWGWSAGHLLQLNINFIQESNKLKKCTDYSRCSVTYWEYERGIRKTKEYLKIVICQFSKLRWIIFNSIDRKTISRLNN